MVIALTALPLAGTSSRTVIEFETLGTVAIDVPSSVRPRGQQIVDVPRQRMLDIDGRTYRGIVRNNVH
ncbi:hypothetical protein GCM10009639_05820 [Kitasatospora putterlickiae]|uniref:Uncharacterized protein n=1 Tax=Kitasatospora putterlickiae TaxID=221725 RepID=A0ABN1XKY4_9ACTN